MTREGLRVGSADLKSWEALFSPDAVKRANAVAVNAEHIAQAVQAGAKNFFVVILPENPSLSRRANFGYAVELLGALAPTDDLYEYGWEQPATFKSDPAFGSSAWRYTIPGRGDTDWSEVLRVLVQHNYAGAICIELEDKDFNGSDEGEQRGLLQSAQFLQECV